MRSDREKAKFIALSETSDPTDQICKTLLAAVDRYRRILARMEMDLLKSVSGNPDLENIHTLAHNMAFDILRLFPGANTDGAMKAIQAGIVDRYGPQT